MRTIALFRPHSHMALLFALALIALVPRFALGAGSDRNAFHAVGQNGSHGLALLSEFPSRGSAGSAFPDVARRLSAYLGTPLAFEGAVGDPADQQLHAFFHATFKGQPVQGKLSVYVGDGQGSALALLDRAGHYAQSSREMLRRVAQPPGEGAAAAPAAAQPLQQVRFPDGKGAIGLPEGWVINNVNNGGVDAHGQGGAVALGVRMTVPINTLPGWVGMRGPMLPPAQAWMAMVDTNTKGGLSRGEARVDIIEEAPQPFNGGQAAYVHYHTVAPGIDREGLALILCSPVDNNHWQMYFSVVLADRPRFAALFPTMWAMWRSWTINPAVFRERMEEGIANMREISRIRQGVSEQMQRSASNRSYAVGQLLQGVTSIEHVETMYRRDIDASAVQPMLRELNRNGEHWQEVPLERINPAER